MHTPEERDEFLEHGRFGEGEHSIYRTRVDPIVWLGLPLLVAAGAYLGLSGILGIGRDPGGPPLFLASILAGSLGALLCVVGLVRMGTRSR